MKQFLLVMSILALVFTGCLKTDEQACNYDPCAAKAPDAQVLALETYLDTNNIVATKHCSGLYYNISDSGSAQKPKDICGAVLVKYSGKLVNGTTFDSNQVGAGFQLGGLIEAWKKAIPLIGRNGNITIYVPPALGYGSADVKDQQTQQVVIPGNSILIFEVELVDFN